MRPYAHIYILALLVKTDYGVIGQIADMFDLVFFVALLHQRNGFFVVAVCSVCVNGFSNITDLVTDDSFQKIFVNFEMLCT